MSSRGYPPRGMIGPRLIAWWSLRTMTDGVRAEGLEHVPASGPVLVVAHHHHHLLDGAVLVAFVPRPVHIVVALDWTANARQRRWMERACASARWPVILRPATTGSRGGYAAGEVGRYLRVGLRDAAELLREGRVVVVFPEGYPVVEPASSGAPPRVRDADGLLPFAAGFRTIAGIAERSGAKGIAVVPLGFRYEQRGKKFAVTARFGPALGAGTAVADVERAVRSLC